MDLTPTKGSFTLKQKVDSITYYLINQHKYYRYLSKNIYYRLLKQIVNLLKLNNS